MTLSQSRSAEITEPALKFHWPNALFAGVWLLMLAYPLLSEWGREPSLFVWVTFLLVNVIFSVVYTAGFGFRASWGERGESHMVAGWMVVVLLTLAAIAGIVGFHIVNYTPWVLALFCFGLTRKWGIVAGVATAAVSLLVIFLVFQDDPLFATYMLLVASSSAVIVPLALAVDFGEERKRDEQNLLVLQERERLARDVHDLLGHSLTVINLKAELARAVVDKDPRVARAELEEIVHLSRTALAEVRSTVTRIERPDFAGEVSAAQRALDTAEIRADLPNPDSAQRISGVNAQLYSWVLREAVTNIVRHAEASSCRVIVTADQLEIVDDGRGFDSVESNEDRGEATSADQRKGGLYGLQRRAEEAGGRLLISHAEPRGTRVLLTMTGDAEPPSEKAASSVVAAPPVQEKAQTRGTEERHDD